jgi:hypothetical protein
MPFRLESITRLAFCAATVAALAGCADGSDADVEETAEAGGAASATAASDLRDVSNYELRMGQVDKYYEAYRNMGEAMKDMTPQQREALDMDASDADLDTYVSRLEGQPAINSAIRDAGLSAREFSLILWSMLQSGMAAAVLDMQPNANQDSLVREMDANMGNVKFMRDNEAELRRKQEALQADMEKMGVTDP